MSPPQDFATWNGLLKLILLLLPPGLLSGRLLWAISAHSVCLSGRRVIEQAQSEIVYRFAIQNNEDVPITGTGRVSIDILDSDANFIKGTTPQVYAGCNAIRTSMDYELRRWTMTFDELPAYETWSIECCADSRAHNLRLAIERAESNSQTTSTNDTVQRPKAAPRLPRLSHSTLALPANKPSVFVGARRTPEAWWAATAVFIALGGYAVAFYYTVYLTYEHFGLDDLIAPMSIVGFGLTLWWLTRRPAPSISQGYWENTAEGPRIDPTPHTLKKDAIAEGP
jgi:hypothetical protein